MEQTSNPLKTFQDFYTKLLKPSSAFDNRGRYEKCSQYWNSMNEAEQQGVYHIIEAKIQAGDFVNPNPCFAMNDAMQEYEKRMAKERQMLKIEPTNYNGRGLKDGVKYVSALYNGQWGMYTEEDVRKYGLKVAER